MKTIPAILLATGAIAFLFSVSKRLFGAYGYSATTEDAIAIAVLGGLAYLVFGHGEKSDEQQG